MSPSSAMDISHPDPFRMSFGVADERRSLMKRRMSAPIQTVAAVLNPFSASPTKKSRRSDQDDVTMHSAEDLPSSSETNISSSSVMHFTQTAPSYLSQTGVSIHPLQTKPAANPQPLESRNCDRTRPAISCARAKPNLVVTIPSAAKFHPAPFNNTKSTPTSTNFASTSSSPASTSTSSLVTPNGNNSSNSTATLTKNIIKPQLSLTIQPRTPSTPSDQLLQRPSAPPAIPRHLNEGQLKRVERLWAPTPTEWNFSSTLNRIPTPLTESFGNVEKGPIMDDTPMSDGPEAGGHPTHDKESQDSTDEIKTGPDVILRHETTADKDEAVMVPVVESPKLLRASLSPDPEPSPGPSFKPRSASPNRRSTRPQLPQIVTKPLSFMPQPTASTSTAANDEIAAELEKEDLLLKVPLRRRSVSPNPRPIALASPYTSRFPSALDSSDSVTPAALSSLHIQTPSSPIPNGGGLPLGLGTASSPIPSTSTFASRTLAPVPSKSSTNLTAAKLAVLRRRASYGPGKLYHTRRMDSLDSTDEEDEEQEGGASSGGGQSLPFFGPLPSTSTSANPVKSHTSVSASATLTTFRGRSESFGFGTGMGSGSGSGLGSRAPSRGGSIGRHHGSGVLALGGGLGSNAASLKLRGGISKSKTLPPAPISSYGVSGGSGHQVRKATSSAGLNALVAAAAAGSPGIGVGVGNGNGSGGGGRDLLGYFDLKPLPIPMDTVEEGGGSSAMVE